MILCELNLYKLHHILSLIYIINFRGTLSFQIDLNWQVLLTLFKCMAQAHCRNFTYISSFSSICSCARHAIVPTMPWPLQAAPFYWLHITCISSVTANWMRWGQNTLPTCSLSVAGQHTMEWPGMKWECSLSFHSRLRNKHFRGFWFSLF